MKKAYLAGAMEHAPDKGAKWRQDITEVLRKHGWGVFNPCIEEESPLTDPAIYVKMRNTDYTGFCKEMSSIVTKDLYELSGCDVVVVRLDKYAMMGAGTIGEVTIAKDYHMEILAWVDMDREEMPGWVSGCLEPDCIVYSQSRLEDLIRRKLEPGDRPAT